MEQLQLAIPQQYQEFQLLSVKAGLDKETIHMAKKRYFILAKCYDKKGRLLSAAFNSYTKTHPLQAYLAQKVGHASQTCLHAEIAAILKCKDKPIYRITTERYDRNGLPANAKPCPICQLAIKMFGIKKVEHT